MFRVLNAPCLMVVTLAVISAALPVQAQSADSDSLAPLLSGMGIYSRPISTNSVTAQQYFDQGLNLTYGYYFVHAVASFQEAIRHDPNNGMLYWGLALAIGPNPNSRYSRAEDDPQGEGKKAIEKAMSLRNAAPSVERALIEALHVRFDDETYPDRDKRDRAYIKAVRRIYKQYPADTEAGFLLADAIMTSSKWSYWDPKGLPKKGTAAAVDALERSVAMHPLHPGANHLYIHLVEASNEPELATAHADRLAGLIPHVGHIVHMPSHTYIRTGRYADAIATNLRSVEVDRILLEEWGDHPFPMICSYNVSAKSHTGHATDFVRFGATFQGNYEQAIEYARITAKTVPIDSVSNRNQRHIATVWLVHKIFGRWSALEEETAPPANNIYLQGMWNYVQGSKLVHEGKLAEAESALTKLEELQSHPDVQVLPIRVNTGAVTFKLATRALAGEIALARGEFDEAIDAFQEAVEREKALGYMEPPDWAQSMRLYLGNAYLKASRPADAERVYRDDLEWWPENGWALYGLWHSLIEQNKDEEADATRKRFDKAWSNADTVLEASVF